MIEVISVRLGEDCESIVVKFKKGDKKGEFEYGFFGNNPDNLGIRGYDYDEADNEDIADEIHEWVEEHIEAYSKILYNGKEIMVRK